MRGELRRQRRAPAGRSRRGLVRGVLRAPRRRPARLLRAAHARRRAGGRPHGRNLRRGPRRPPPLPARGWPGGRVAVRHREQEARRRPAPRLRRAPRAAPARHGATRAQRRGHRAHRAARRGRPRDAAGPRPRARPARGDRRPRGRRAQLRGHRGRPPHLGGRGPQARQPGAGDGPPDDGRARVSAEDFTTRLQLQLREAAEREERRGPAARRIATVRGTLAPRLALGPALAAAAPGLVLRVARGALTAGGSDRGPEPATPPGPRVVGTVPIGDALNGGGIAAFGAVWVSDSGRGQIVKVDPDSRRVTAPIPVEGETEMTAADGSLWAVRNASGTPSGPLLRIDPRTGRIVRRIALRTPAGDPFFGGFPIAAGSRLLIGGAPSDAPR